VPKRPLSRAAAAPVSFLTRGGFARFVAEHATGRRRPSGDPPVILPRDIALFLDTLGGRTLADFVPRIPSSSFARLATAGGPDLLALLAGAPPIGTKVTEPRELVVCFLTDRPLQGVIAALTMGERISIRLLCRGAAELALICSMEAADEDVELPPTSIVDEEAAAARLDRARLLVSLLGGKKVASSLRALRTKLLDTPPPAQDLGGERSAPLALGEIVAAFFKGEPDLVRAHLSSGDRLVRDAAQVLLAPSKLASSTRQVPSPKISDPDVLGTTRLIVSRYAILVPNAESFASVQERDELFFALSALGSPAIAPELRARAHEGEAAAVDMLAALGDTTLVTELLEAGDLFASGGLGRNARIYAGAIARLCAATNETRSAPELRRLLRENPLTSWRAGLERGLLVRELVVALGELRDGEAAAELLEMLASTSQEYRPVLPYAAWALGRIAHEGALPGLERLLLSPKDAVTCEAVWAVGAIGRAHPSARERGRTLLEGLAGLEPGAEAVRWVSLAKLGAKVTAGVLHRAIARAIEEPAFRQEETSRRQAWALAMLEELASFTKAPPSFLARYELVRAFVTRDDPRVRKAAHGAFRAWKTFVPETRAYSTFILPSIERDGGLEALHEAVRDPLGIHRHVVATRLAEIGDPRSTRPLAEATARLFGEPVTSTYEYDDAPPHLVAFVRSLARLNQPEGNDVLIEGLRAGNHQVRAVVAENAPDDPRFVPELMAMLGDARSFLRSRAEKSLMALGAIPRPAPPGTAEVGVALRSVEG
jgi:HEAT repeat protein